jgi:hypothetical protein
MAEQPTFQWDDGGSTPTLPLQSSDVRKYRVRLCDWSDIAPLLRRFHYRKDYIGGSVRFCLGLYANEFLLGGAAMGDPRHRERYGGKENVIELRRLVCHELAPKNTESYFIGRILWWTRKFTGYTKVLSYADTSVGHSGTIYRASNFSLIGTTSASQLLVYEGREYHMRSLTINRPYAERLRQAYESGAAKVVTGGAKNIFMYELGVA